MNKRKVFLTGGDGIGWAVDEDMRLTARALSGLIEPTDLDRCEAVHCVWWEGLMMLPRDALAGKRFICHVPGEPFRYFGVPAHRKAMALVGRWITRSTQAAAQLRGVGIESTVVPYLVDTDIFKPLPSAQSQLQALRTEWNIPDDAYLIGSFQRDTEGADLSRPKLVKGPDVLLEILLGLRRRSPNVHAVLAGPRRHWLRARLTELNIPFTYVGTPMESEDLEVNSLPRSTLNLLYNLVDLYIVASRSEGGPHAILEASASQCKVISTAVGMARDVLDATVIFETPADAVATIERDITTDSLAFTLDRNARRVQVSHTPEATRPLFENLYRELDSIGIYRPRTIQLRTDGAPTVEQIEDRSLESQKKPLTVGLWHSFFKPPYGGGNQFMMALRKGMAKRGVDVRENELHPGIDAYVLNSIHFDVDRFLEFTREHKINVIHRIDGPIFLIRGFDREKDELCYELNERFASATVLQSAWTYQRIVDMGYHPIRPVIIHNAVDSDIFHARGRIPFDNKRKIRLIATSWSGNPRKGGPTYKWIDEHLDWERFELTFVGNVSESFDRIKHIPPIPSEDLASILRQHDIYITASRNDPCSNALIEALACGLPALYFNDGGHPELVGYGGLPFSNEEEIPSQLERIVDNYESFQRLVIVSSLEDVAGKYLSLIEEVVQ